MLIKDQEFGINGEINIHKPIQWNKIYWMIIKRHIASFKWLKYSTAEEIYWVIILDNIASSEHSK